MHRNALFESCVLVACALAGCGDNNLPARLDAPPADAMTASLARGEYLVEHVANCSGCHTPRLPNGSEDRSRVLGGNDCLLDVAPDDAATGCLATPNLTSDATGLGLRTDDEIKRMVRDGIAADGTALDPFMPYQIFHWLTDADADSIVLYLRSLPHINHIADSQSSWSSPPQPAPPIPNAAIPRSSVRSPRTANGRYLATLACMECHSPRTDRADFGSYDLAKLFAGGREFPSAALGLWVPPFPPGIFTWNLTPDPDGIERLTRQQIHDILTIGVDPERNLICPPMPTGAMAAFGGLRDDDIADIIAFLRTIPFVPNAIPSDCVPPPPLT